MIKAFKGPFRLSGNWRAPPVRHAVKLHVSQNLSGTIVLMSKTFKGQLAPELRALPGAFSGSFMVSANALSVIRSIKEKGHCAFIVGGAVRDALTGGAPADFDIATEAWPAYVMRAVPGSRTLGRRFVIVVREFGEETVEITTFRRENSGGRGQFGNNRYGSLMDDAMARDFTINALYLDPFSGVILDPLDGLQDLAERRVRLIGDPRERFGNDAVRLLRAVRFASVPGYHLDDGTRKGIVRHSELLRRVNHRRLTAELIRLFDKNESRQLELFFGLGLMDAVIAGMNEVRRVMNPSDVSAFLRRAGALSEKLHEYGASADGCTAFAVLLWLPMLALAKSRSVDGKISADGIRKCAGIVLRRQQAYTLIPPADAMRLQLVLAAQLIREERDPGGAMARSALFLRAARKGEISGDDQARLAGLFRKRIPDGYDHNGHSVSALPDEKLSRVSVRSVCSGSWCGHMASRLRSMPAAPVPPAPEPPGVRLGTWRNASGPGSGPADELSRADDAGENDLAGDGGDVSALPSGYAVYIKEGKVTRCPDFISQAASRITLPGRFPQGGGFFRKFTPRQIRLMLGDAMAGTLKAAGNDGIRSMLEGYSSDDIHFYPEPQGTGIVAISGPDVRSALRVLRQETPASAGEILKAVRRIHPGFTPEKIFGSPEGWLRCAFFTESSGLWRPGTAGDCFVLGGRNLGVRVSEMITMSFTFPVRTWEGAVRILKRLRLGDDHEGVLSGLASLSMRPDITDEGIVLAENDGTRGQAASAGKRIHEFAARAMAQYGGADEDYESLGE